MKAVVERIVPVGGAVTVAVDDTLFHRYGRKVHGARYQHDGSAKGRDGIGRGNCFVIVGIVVAVPFLARQVCLPVLFRLHIPKASASKTEQARAMVDLLAQALPRRTVHVVGDGLYRSPTWRGLPARVTFTTRLAASAGSVRARTTAHRQARTPRMEGRTPGHRRRDGRHRRLAAHHRDPLRGDRSRRPRGDHLPVVGQPAPHPRPRGPGWSVLDV